VTSWHWIKSYNRERSTYNKFIITSLKYIMLRIYFSSLVKGRKMEKSSRDCWLLIHISTQSIFDFLFFFFFPTSRISYLIVRPRSIHSRLLSPVLWMRLGRAPRRCIHEKRLFPQSFVRTISVYRTRWPIQTHLCA